MDKTQALVIPSVARVTKECQLQLKKRAAARSKAKSLTLPPAAGVVALPFVVVKCDFMLPWLLIAFSAQVILCELAYALLQAHGSMFFIDSTHGTNSAEMQLFAVAVRVPTGILLACIDVPPKFYLQANTFGQLSSFVVVHAPTALLVGFANCS